MKVIYAFILKKKEDFNNKYFALKLARKKKARKDKSTKKTLHFNLGHLDASQAGPPI